MVENEVIGDLGDLRAFVYELRDNDTINNDVFYVLLEQIDEKMDKYSGKSVIIKCGWGE